MFSCEISGCGAIHLYHDIDNLQTWLDREIKPNLSKLNFEETGKENPINREIREYRKTLDQFIIDEKRKCDMSYKNILSNLESIYSNSLDEINEFGFNTTSQFEELSCYIKSTQGIRIFKF